MHPQTTPPLPLPPPPMRMPHDSRKHRVRSPSTHVHSALRRGERSSTIVNVSGSSNARDE